MSGEEEVDSFEDLDLDEDFEAVRLQVYWKKKQKVSWEINNWIKIMWIKLTFRLGVCISGCASFLEFSVPSLVFTLNLSVCPGP